MIQKRPLDPRRLRCAPPPGFGWIDHRFLSEGYFRRCSPPALALYGLLVCAADAQGLSFYGDARAGELLGLDVARLRSARAELIEAGLLAFQKPLSQVLALEDRRQPCLVASRTPAAKPAPTPASLPASPPPRKRPAEAPFAAPVAAPAGLDLRSMVEASLKKGGAQ